MSLQTQVAIDMQIADVLYPKARHRTSASVRQLALAILIQALRDTFGTRRATRDDEIDWKSDAREWFSEEDSSPGSFQWVCQILGYEPDVLVAWVDSNDQKSSMGATDIYNRVKRLQIPRLRSF